MIKGCSLLSLKALQFYFELRIGFPKVFKGHTFAEKCYMMVPWKVLMIIDAFVNL